MNNGFAVGSNSVGRESPSNAFAAMPKYEAYKNSGVDWLGSVPDSWKLTRLGTRFFERRAKVSDTDFPPLSVTKQGILPQLENAAKTKDGYNRKLVKSGDFVINSRSDRKGSSGVSDRDGSVSLINIVLEPKGIHPKFSEHLLKSYAFVEEYYRVGRGIVADLWTTRYDEMRTITLAVPSYEEQVAISNFLGHKTAQIDEAVSIKEKQITLLKERKQIIIQKAVTQGLNPDVPKKDSGVDWIGGVPSSWTVRKLKYFTSFMGGGTPSKENMDYWGGDIPWVSPKDMKFDVIETSIDSITELAVKKSSVKLVPTNSILIVVRGMILARKIPVAITAKKVTINQDMKALTVNENVCVPLFLRLILDGLHKEISNLLEESGHGTKTLPTEKLGGFSLPLPSIFEQNQILDFVAKQSDAIEKAIKIQESQIDKIKEYKATLINSAVTGKIKVA